MKTDLTTLRVRIFRPFFSLFINGSFWALNIFSLPGAIRRLNDMGKEIRTMADVAEMLGRLRLRENPAPKWRPWVVTIIQQDLVVDDSGAAQFGKWVLSRVDVDSRLHTLSGKDGDHVVCISSSKQFMTSGTEMVKIAPWRWREDVLEMFDGRYRRILG
jgi:hypothetical protein